MVKWGKKLLGLAAAGAAVAGLIYYFKSKNACDSDDEFTDEFEDEDFDLDNDLKPVSDREYVPLNSAAKAEETKTASSDSSTSESASEEDK